MVRIGHSDATNESGAKSIMSSGPSQIPGPKGLETAPYSQRISRLISIHQNLARKAEPAAPGTHASLSSRVSKLEESLASTFLKQVEEDHNLDVQLRQLRDERNNLEEEIVELKREHKRFGNQIGALRAHIQTLGKKFDFTEEAIMKNVAHKEQLINLQLKELSNQLNDEYNEIQFQLSQELEKAKVYNDEDLLREIATLTSERNGLLAEVESAKAKKTEALDTEAMSIQKELDVFRIEMETQIESINETYKKHQESFDSVSKELEMARALVSSKNDHNDKLKDEIRQMEHDIENFALIASEYDRELLEVSSQLTTIAREEAEWDTKFRHAEAKYKAVALKIDQHNRLRQILENSIMDYESCLRVYVKVPESYKIEGKDTVIINNLQFAYNKVFSRNTPDFELIKEFACLTNSALSLANVSVIFSGANGSSLMKQSVISSYKGLLAKMQSSKYKSVWDFKFSLQGIRVGGESIYDLLNSSNTVNISHFSTGLIQILSQKMLIDDTSALGRIIEALPDENDVVVLLSISASDSISLKSFESSIMFLSLWNNSLPQQCSIMSGTGTSSVLSKIINYAHTQTKCLHLSTLEDYNEALLVELQNLKSTKVQTKQ